jgi:hypothetical protein
LTFDPEGNEGAAGYIQIDNQGEQLAYVQLVFIIGESLHIGSFQHKAVAVPPETGLTIGPLDLVEFQSEQIWFKLFSSSDPFDVSNWLQQGLGLQGGFGY